MSDNDSEWPAYVTGGRSHGRGADTPQPVPDGPDSLEAEGYVVEDSIPLPPRRAMGAIRVTVDSLTPGQSFKFFGAKNLDVVKNAITSNKRLDNTKVFATRHLEKTAQGEYFYRVWRIR